MLKQFTGDIIASIQEIKPLASEQKLRNTFFSFLFTMENFFFKL